MEAHMKSKRHALILEIIASQDIETQESLAQALEQSGVKVTQATVSRDIKELRLVKVLTENGAYKYAQADKAESADGSDDGMAGADHMVRFFAQSVRSIAGAGNLIVCKTNTAAAQTAAEFIDNLKWPEIVGTIAGDNTVLAIIQNIEDVDEVIARFEAMIGKKA